MRQPVTLRMRSSKSAISNPDSFALRPELYTMAPRTKSSARWLREHRDDYFVREANREGFRSRAAYKLAELDDRGHFLTPGASVVDLGAAPGGWSQLAVQRVGPSGRVVAVDILPMEPLDGVEILQGDFLESRVAKQLRNLLDGTGVQVVLSDMAPNISGIRDVDQARSMALAELALDFAREVCIPGGTLLVKVFQGEGYDGLREDLVHSFKRVVARKPTASRPRSREIYLCASGYDV